jgi:hypothetical protein
MAPIMAGVLASGLGATSAMAQAGNSIAAVACEVSYTEGTFENGKPNYVATANRGEFAFLAPMAAVSDQVSLYSSELGGAVREGIASIKGAITRDSSGAMNIENLQLAWPFTVLEREGQYYSIIQMAHDQDVGVGLSIEVGGEPLGEIAFQKGAFDPNQPVVGFDVDAVGAIHEGLMSDKPLVANLVVGGEVYSRVSPQAGAYRTFVKQTLSAAMDEAGRRDAEDPCLFTNPDALLEMLNF